MTEEELQQKRKEFRDQEVEKKIGQYTDASEYRQQSLKAHYTVKKVDARLGKAGLILVVIQGISLLFFSTLYIMSYIPSTKKVVTFVMP